MGAKAFNGTTSCNKAQKKYIRKFKKIKKNLYQWKKYKLYYFKTGDVRFDISLLNQENLNVLDDDKSISNKDIGVENIKLQDAAGSYAYHIQRAYYYILIQKKKKLTNLQIKSMDTN